MTAKAINLTYWISTFTFAALMIFSSVGGIQPSQAAIQLMHDGLGYPVYFIQFISIAKLIGAIAILIPGLTGSRNGLMRVCFSTSRVLSILVLHL